MHHFTAAMPHPGDPYAQAFIVEPGECWRMFRDRQEQEAHCAQAPAYTGRWLAPSGKQWWRVWSCERHLDGLTGIREFGPTARS